jgi:hypothetical protein
MTYIELSDTQAREVIVLGFEDAVVLETMQNIERDIRVGLEDIKRSSLIWDVYESEARHILKLYGFGYDPEYNDHYLVVVKQE